jgi:hypothetical protein
MSNLLKNQSVIITIDPDNETYSLEFIGASVSNAYRVLRTVLESMESGEMFENDIRISDSNGNPYTRDEARRLIQGIKAEMDAQGTSQFGHTLD